MRVSQRFLVLVACVVCVGGSTVASASTTNAAAKAGKSKASMLFSLSGDNALLVPVAGTRGQYSFSMPIRSSSSQVTMFTDRPEREAGVLTIDQFVQMWSSGGTNSFASDPPNAAIVYSSPAGKSKTMIVEMSNPSIAPNPKGSGKLLKATMTILLEAERATLAKTKGHLANHANRAVRPKKIKAADTKRIALFVDNFSTATWGNCMYQIGGIGNYNGGAWSWYAPPNYTDQLVLPLCIGPTLYG